MADGVRGSANEGLHYALNIVERRDCFFWEGALGKGFQVVGSVRRLDRTVVNETAIFTRTAPVLSDFEILRRILVGHVESGGQ